MTWVNLPEPIHGTWGQNVYRLPEGILKLAIHHDGLDRYEARCAGIAREAYLLDRMAGSGITPQVLDIGDGWILLEDLGVSQVPSSGEKFRRVLTRLLHRIREFGVIHGDLTFPNMVLHEDGAWAVDWQDGSVVGEEPPLQKHERSDSFLVWRVVRDHHEPSWHDSLLADTPRVARRWMDVLHDTGADYDPTFPLQGRRFVDLGCFQGDFVAAAAAEGMDALGVDKGGFRTGENSIEIGRELWAGISPFRSNSQFGSVTLVQDDLTFSAAVHSYVEGADIAMCFSTWPYLLQDAGWGTPGPFTKEEGIDWLEGIVRRVGRLYFETQYAGDGPGPLWLKGDADVDAMFASRSLKAVIIGKHPVAGRPAERTVWRVTYAPAPK